MLLTVRNLGPIKDAVIDLSKKFTLFCGLNSTGKTYLSYIVYSLFQYNATDLKSYKLAKESVLVNDCYSLTNEDINEYVDSLSLYVKNHLDSILCLSNDIIKNSFSEFYVKLILTDSDYEEIFAMYFMSKKGDSVAKKAANSYEIRFSEESLPNSRWSELLSSIIMRDGIMLPVERNSINTFKRQLSINRFDYLNKLAGLENSSSSEILEFMNSMPHYPQVIDNEMFIEGDLSFYKNEKSNLLNIAQEIENAILRGSICINDDNDIEFKINDQISLPMATTSSLVKTLSSLIICVKHRCYSGDHLIIDEPEMNLHPSNQVLLAPIFAKLANNGVKLVISSHSDYFIREINSLIVAKSLKDKGDDAYKQYYKEDSLLDYKDVQVLYFDFDKDGLVRVKSLDVDEYGFAVDSIDETINLQNQRMMDLFGRMNESDNSNDVEND